MNTTPAIPWTTLLTACILTLPLCAAERDRDARGDRPAARRDAPAHPADTPSGPGIEHFLNEEQRARLREAMSAQREKMQKLEARAAELRQDIEESLLAEKLDEKALRKKSAELAEIQTERQMMRARAFARLRESLNPEQLERLRERLKHRVRERFDGRPMDLPPRRPGPRLGEDFRRPRDLDPRREDARHPEGAPDRREFQPRRPAPPRPPGPDSRPNAGDFRGPPDGDHRPEPPPLQDYRRPRGAAEPPAPPMEPRRREAAREGREAREREEAREPRERRGEREQDEREDRRPPPARERD